MEAKIIFENIVSPNPTPYPYEVQITYGYPYYEDSTATSSMSRNIHYNFHLRSDNPQAKIQLEEFYLTYNGERLDSSIVNNTSGGFASPLNGDFPNKFPF